MAQNANAIHVGAARIFVGGVNPTSGAPPTLSVHTNGVPSTPQTGYTEVGHTFEDTVFTYTPDVRDIESEQAFGIVDTYVSGQACELTFTCQERTYKAILTAFGGLSSVNDVNKMLFYGGGVYAVLSQSVIWTSPDRITPSKYEVGTIYKAQCVTPVPLMYSRVNPSRYKVTLRGVHDTTRTVLDQQFQVFKEL